MPQCDKCKKEFYSPNPTGLTLFEGKCLDCLTPEQREKLKQALLRYAGVIEISIDKAPVNHYNIST